MGLKKSIIDCIRTYQVGGYR